MVQISIFIVAIDFHSPGQISRVFHPPGTTWYCLSVGSMNTVRGRPDRLVLKNLRTQPPVPVGVWAECIHVSFRAPAKCSGGGSGDCLTHQECLGVTFAEPWWVVEVSTGGVRLTTIGYVSGRSFLRPF